MHIRKWDERRVNNTGGGGGGSTIPPDDNTEGVGYEDEDNCLGPCSFNILMYPMSFYPAGLILIMKTGQVNSDKSRNMMTLPITEEDCDCR